MATSAINAVRTALVSAITSQLSSDGIVRVDVWAFDPSDLEGSRDDYVAITDIEADQEHMTMGGADGAEREDLTVTGVVVAYVSGGTNDDAETAEDRALDIFGSVETTVRNGPDLDGTHGIFHAELVRKESRLTADPSGIVCIVEFDIDVEAHL